VPFIGLLLTAAFYILNVTADAYIEQYKDNIYSITKDLGFIRLRESIEFFEDLHKQHNWLVFRIVYVLTVLLWVVVLIYSPKNGFKPPSSRRKSKIRSAPEALC
jgi:4-amino-4-deoxy-L-arabinose transferase-like glycosyltransferase